MSQDITIFEMFPDKTLFRSRHRCLKHGAGFTFAVCSRRSCKCSRTALWHLARLSGVIFSPAAQLAVVEPHDEEVPALVFISPHLGLLHLQVACNIQGMCKPDLEGTMIAPLSIIVCKREKQHRSAACSQRLHQLELQHQPHTSRAGYADFKCLLCTSCTQQNPQHTASHVMS